MGVEEVSVCASSGSAERVIDAKAVATPTSSSRASFETEAQALRRRTSIPSTFSFGGVDHTIPTADVTQRRWRSFDAAVLDGPAASTLNMLTQRIQEESQQVLKRKARLSRRREVLRSVKCWLSSSRRDQVALLQMQLVAELATGNRSLAVLSDMRTLLALDQHSDDSSPRHRGSFAANQTLLEGIEQSDRALADDYLRHVLQLQADYLKQLMQLHSDKKRTSISGVTLLQLLQRADDLATANDQPTPVLVQFEKLLSGKKLLKPELKKALDKLCLTTMRSFTRSSTSESCDKSIFDDREARDVMQSLVQEVVDAIATEAKLPKCNLPQLQMFVEHMVFTRLASACFRDTSADLDELNASWRDQAPKLRALTLAEVGLTVPIPEHATSEMFSESIAAFNQLPHLVPASVLAAFMRAICTLYREAKDGLGLDSTCISADVLLPLLVFVLSRCEVPHLHSQVFLMEQYAISESQDGSEAAYYVACLQAAMGYIMGKESG
ncbi:hypothetical protein PHYBOEH_002802 [Phytophthora boehmeriae]|uniref:VPS9 domain-containing protein n=1 Tax=Phytophthora boehmeriae TaxID=109152 RepID=A0A8T1WX09_9STRA|nr:hypothetical protein PHYBOEH_002802 [Phytophthora boehmeriae]